MDKIKKSISGKKTYIVAGLMVCVGLIQCVSGELTLVEFVSSSYLQTILQGLGLITLRVGVKKAEVKKL